MISPADHPMILSLIIVNATVCTINAKGRIYTKNFFREKNFALIIYIIGIHTARILQSTNFQFIQLANIV